jgi:hypothetical protein
MTGSIISSVRLRPVSSSHVISLAFMPAVYGRSIPWWTDLELSHSARGEVRQDLLGF